MEGDFKFKLDHTTNLTERVYEIFYQLPDFLRHAFDTNKPVKRRSPDSDEEDGPWGMWMIIGGYFNRKARGCYTPEQIEAAEKRWYAMADEIENRLGFRFGPDIGPGTLWGGEKDEDS